MRGTVKWFDPKKGYGFIQCPGEEDIFVHYSSIRQRGFWRAPFAATSA